MDRLPAEVPDSAAPFFNPAELALTREFLNAGYVLRPAADRAALDRIRD